MGSMELAIIVCLSCTFGISTVDSNVGDSFNVGNVGCVDF